MPGSSVLRCLPCVCLVAPSHLTPCDSMNCKPARILCPWRFSRQEYWSGLPCPPPGDLPNPGIEPRSLALQVDSLSSEIPGKPHYISKFAQIHVHGGAGAIQPSHPLPPLLPPSIFCSIRIFSRESALCIRWPKCWSFSFSISPFNEYCLRY